MKRDYELFHCFGWVISFCIAHFCKLSFIVGSYTAGFSGINVLMPLTGALGSSFGSGIIFLLQLLLYSSKSFSAFHYLAFILPGLCAALYWRNNSPVIRALLPLTCMMLFIIHPVGFYAAPYALLWLLPIGVFLFNRQSLFLHSLSSTFIGHAVGSIIWLYAIPMESEIWLSLIPVAILERLFFASAITLCYRLVIYLKQSQSQKNYVLFPSR